MRSRALCLAALTALGVTACEGDGTDSQGPASGGTGGTAGSGTGTGGSGATSAGSGNAGGTGGDGAGGTAGSSGSGAASSGGSGGAGGSGAEAGSGGADAGGAGGTSGGGGTSGSAGSGGSGDCFDATLLWSEDFEAGNYDRWTSVDYDAGWNNGTCHDNGFSSEEAVSGTNSHRSEITCTISESHRGYGGMQFAGDTPLADYTNSGTGIEAPFGVVNTYWSWLNAGYPFGNGKWFSFFTVNSACDWSEDVITLGLEDATNRLTPAHIKNTGGTVEFAKNAPVVPLGEWVRTTVYINYQAGVMHVWQNGQDLLHATFSRPTTDICQWHWGAYASGDNDNIVLYEDDLSIYKLNAEWTDFSVEPWFGGTVKPCSP